MLFLLPTLRQNLNVVFSANDDGEYGPAYLVYQDGMMQSFKAPAVIHQQDWRRGILYYFEGFRKNYVKKNIELYIEYIIIFNYFSNVEIGIEIN